MTADIHLHEEPDRTNQILAKLGDILERVEFMAGELDKLAREVAETGTVIDSTVVLLGNLAQQIRDLKTEPAKLEALASELDAKTARLAAAVAENTEAGTPPRP